MGINYHESARIFGSRARAQNTFIFIAGINKIERLQENRK